MQPGYTCCMNAVPDFANSIATEIDEAYTASGNELGWRFLYSPADVLDGAQVAFIGLNPGGRSEEAAHGQFAMDSGSAYRDELWPRSSRLQAQVLALFRRLEVAPEDVLAGNLVPFRSPDWKSLKTPRQSLRFGCQLWAHVLQRARPSLVVSMGAEANAAVAGLLDVGNMVKEPVGWGRVSAKRAEFANGTWIGLPHLSRFAIMDRTASAAHLDRLFRGLQCRS